MVQENLADPRGRIVVLLGPTATGKTGVSLELARRFSLEIVNCDASQFYIGLDIGTAKPDAGELAQAPHHLFDIAPPEQPINAGDYVALADEAIARIYSRGSTPLVVGGTGMYIRALTRGLAAIPQVSPEVQQRVREKLDRTGSQRMYLELQQVDPDSAGRISANDPQRISRALEVYQETGRTITSFQDEHRFAPQRYVAFKAGLHFEPDHLKKRIAKRVHQMFEAGFPGEVRRLLEEGSDFTVRTFKALGYRDVADFVQGNIGKEEAISRVITLHQRYAKRQRTWFGKDADVNWFKPQEESLLYDKVGGFLA
jgi:tRNA dimethylallyltransferase